MTSRKKEMVPVKSAGVAPDMAKSATELPGSVRKRSSPQVLKAELNKGVLKLSIDEELLGERNEADIYGSDSPAFQSYAIAKLLNILEAGGAGDLTFNANTTLAMLSGIGPRDELEGMLAAQMVATHHLAMCQLNKHAYSKGLIQHEAHANLATKLMRTFTMQMEALNRHRRGGKQIVEHVHINAGGQAVIAGTVNTGTRG